MPKLEHSVCKRPFFCLNLKLFESDHNPSALLEIPLQM